jgi:hypothetical protein
MKRCPFIPVCSGLAILAGSFSFMGNAQAVTLLSENFEGAGNVFGATTYNYAQNYTMPNLLVPGGGLKYMNGGAGINGSVSTNTFTATGSPLSLLTGGITGGQIDGGLVSYNLYAQFSTYRLQGDYSGLTLQFLDSSSNPVGSLLQIGGSLFTSLLGSGNNGSYADARDWGADSLAGLVPSGARSAAIQIFAVKVPAGGAIDGYVDNVNITIASVPEPGSMALLAIGGGLAAWARRRR